MPIPLDSELNFQIILCLKETGCLFSCYFFLHFPPEAPRLPTQILFYTMAIPTLKWPARNVAPKTIGEWPARNSAPKTTGDTPMYSDNEGPNPNANDTPTFSQSSITSGYYNTNSYSNVTWFIDKQMLADAMLTILLPNGHGIKDLKLE
jgi:hypothetical protein